MDTVLFAFGLIVSQVFVLVVVMIWTGVAGPAQEWLCEIFLDPLVRARNPQPEPEPGDSFVLISDIHLDTWNLAPYKRQTFAAFLRWVQNVGTRELYINGDILDVPPHPLNQPDIDTLRVRTCRPTDDDSRYPDNVSTGPLGVILEENVDSLQALGGMVANTDGPPRTMVTYITGNHDMGLEGMRFIRPELPWNAIRVAWNPSIVLMMEDDRWVYLEHGHQHDPFIWLYTRYAILDLLRSPGRSTAGQRGGRVGMGHNSNCLTAAPPTQPGTFPWERLDDRGRPPKDLAVKEPFSMKLAKYRFRQAARKRFRSFHGAEKRHVRTVTFGHTHIPDRYFFPAYGLYVNSGDWAGNDNHQCYLEICRNGVVTGPHQWRGVPPAPAATVEGTTRE